MHIFGRFQLLIYFAYMLSTRSWVISFPTYPRIANSMAKNNINYPAAVPAMCRLTHRSSYLDKKSMSIYESGNSKLLLPLGDPYEQRKSPPVNTSYPERVSDLIDNLVEIDQTTGLKDNLDYVLLTENSDALCKYETYDIVMSQKFETSSRSGPLSQSLQRVDSLLRGFISSERNVRSRLKVTYLLAGATSSNLEYCVEMLAASGEIDDFLFQHLSDRIKLEEQRLEVFRSEENSELKELKIAKKKQMIEVLQIFYRRLKTEIKWKDHREMKLLSRLINEPNPSVRDFHWLY